MSSSDITTINNYYITNFPSATFIANSSTTYNCHSYAWNMKWGGPTCWLMQSPDLHYYWDDCSYALTNDIGVDVIFYHNGDHSAVKSSVSGQYESKWGSAPLMRHAPDYGPSTYNMSDRKYYRKNPLVINGEYVYYSASYALSTCYQATSWSLSQSGSIFSISSSNSTSATVTATPKNDGKSYSATIYATISGETISKTITMSAIIGSAFLCPTANYFINTGEIPLY